MTAQVLEPAKLAFKQEYALGRDHWILRGRIFSAARRMSMQEGADPLFQFDRLPKDHMNSANAEQVAANATTGGHSVYPRAGQGRLTAEMEVIHRRQQKATAQLPEITQIPADQARAQYARGQAYWNEFDERQFTIERFQIPLATANMDALRVTLNWHSEAATGTLLYLHGGGWMFGSIDTHLGIMARLAESTGLDVIGINYGLAPEVPFPGGLNDSLAAWRWLREQGPRMQLTGPWLLAGDSSGANLALALMLELRDAGETLPDAALLFYGVYADDHTTESHRLCGQGQFALSSARMVWYRDQYAGGQAPNPLEPRMWPLHANLGGLPPLFITAAEFDPLHDDSVALARRVADTGGCFEFKAYAGVIHGFMHMSLELPVAVASFKDAAGFVKVALSR